MAMNTPRRLTATRRSQSSSVISVRRLDRLLDACVVEGDVEAAEALDRSVKRRTDVVGARDVTGHGERVAAGLLDHSRRLAVAVGGDVGHDDVRAFAGEGQRGGAADAGRRSGDEGDLVVEAAHGRNSTLMASRWSIAR
jgi:hypothetical protein